VGERPRLDEAALVWAAALVQDRDPAEVLAGADTTALTRIVHEVADIVDPVDAGARLLVELLQQRPFPGPASAIAWLAVVDLMRSAGHPVRATTQEVRTLCRSVRSGRRATEGAATALRRWTAPPGLPCPVCDRRVYADDPMTRSLVARHGTPYELTSRCAYEHRAHDRSGRAYASVTAGAS
jgi:hypothetical protein